MDPLTRIAHDTGVPRDALLMAVAQAVHAHRPDVDDVTDSAPPKLVEGNPDDPHGELVSMADAAKRLGIPHTTVSSWVRRGHVKSYGLIAKTGQPRLVDIDEVRFVANNPRRNGRPPGSGRPLRPAYVRELQASN